MISLSDAIRLESSNPAVNTFKPWWEIWIDYTLNTFLLVVLFALAGVTISGTPGLVCLPSDTSQTKLNYATNFYVNAKCTTHIDGHILILFPYIIFVQWLLLFVLHLSWFNLPDLKAFLESSFDTFMTMKQENNLVLQAKKKSKQWMEKNEPSTKPKDDEEDGTGDDPLKSGRNARLVYLVDWLQYLLQFKYNLVNFYTIKSIATCGLTVIFSAGLVSSLVTFRWKSAFSCDLRGSLPPPFHLNSCSFSAAPYVYSMMLLNVIFTIVLCIFNLQAIFWLLKFRYIYWYYQHRVWQNNHPLKGKPGFLDYFFCIHLMKANSADGDAIFKTMEEAFKTFQNKLPEEKSSVVSESALVIPESPRHCKNQFILTEVLKELGMSMKKSPQNDLWAGLANSKDRDEPLQPKELATAVRKIREKVQAALLEKHALFKDLINKDDHCPMFEDYIEDVALDEVRDKGIKEDHYILMAFAIAYKVNVVIIRADKSSLLYEPEKPEINQSVRFLTFIPPQYYYATFSDPQATQDENAGLKFLTDQIYQTDLLKDAKDRWQTNGYAEYKKNLENILPRELPYQVSDRSRNISVSELDKKASGLRQRGSKSRGEKKKIEHFALMEAV
ncbi:uncharacterized protein LOC114532622 [Dendronephthya gigantea]|uniref:uncharacterized protein LOC114532622 n=1 Tax=Dendronephthya gigantea TaxID=151771 RepID=UPI00106D4CFB|nr:uncharacterized protein LOC114532622 [Dendronephthya gigantea]